MNPQVREFLKKHICASDPEGSFKFGPWPIPSDQIFMLTPLSYATVNLKPVLPGHMLVISRRCVERMNELTAEEVSDLYRTVQAVGELVERRYGRRALTVSTQDGRDAGQTVPHVHVHVLPRAPDDFKNNDEVYDAIDKADMNRPTTKGPDCEDRKPRTDEEMASEAADLRAFGQKLVSESA